MTLTHVSFSGEIANVHVSRVNDQKYNVVGFRIVSEPYDHTQQGCNFTYPLPHTDAEIEAICRAVLIEGNGSLKPIVGVTEVRQTLNTLFL